MTWSLYFQIQKRLGLGDRVERTVTTILVGTVDFFAVVVRSATVRWEVVGTLLKLDMDEIEALDI